MRTHLDREALAGSGQAGPARSAATRSVAAEVALGLTSPGRRLEPGTARELGARLSHDFANVRVHAGRQATESAQRLGARAYTVGSHIVLGPGEDRPDTSSYQRLMGHELVHVVQGRGRPGGVGRPSALSPPDHPAEREAEQVGRAAASGGPVPAVAQATAASQLHRQPPTPARSGPRVDGDPVRPSPRGGVAITGGTLTWELRFAGTVNREPQVQPEQTTLSPNRAADVRMRARFTSSGQGRACRTVTFVQTVRRRAGGVTTLLPHLLFLRDPASGFAADVLRERRAPAAAPGAAQPAQPQGIPETEPYTGVDARAGQAGLFPEAGAQPAPTGHGTAGQEARFQDAPFDSPEQIPRNVRSVSEFELAVVCVESGAVLGSVRWGYTKTSDQVIRLTGARPADVRVGSASPAFEAARRGFYAGLFEESLAGFARGSARLRSSHRRVLRRLARLANVRRVILVGSSDNSGGPEANPALSLRRAEAARDLLVRLGVPAANILVEGHGVTARVANRAGRAVAANRRVDIHLQRGHTGAQHGAPGSAAEAFDMQHRDPQELVQTVVDMLLDARASGTVLAEDDCNRLRSLLWAIDSWRRRGVHVPDIRTLYSSVIARVLARCRRHIPRAHIPGLSGPMGGLGRPPSTRPPRLEEGP